jgi:hypothetical protein
VETAAASIGPLPCGLSRTPPSRGLNGTRQVLSDTSRDQEANATESGKKNGRSVVDVAH